MARRANRFPKYPSRPHSSGQARITIKGRDYYLGVFGSPEAAAEYARLAAEWAEQRKATPRISKRSTKQTISSLIAAWTAYESKSRGLDNREVIGIARAAVPLDRLFGDTRADEFSAKRLEQVQLAMRDASWMTDEERTKLPQWSRNYCNRQVDRVVRIFRWAERNELVPRGTVEHLRTLEPIKVNDKKAKHSPGRVASDYETQVKPALPYMPPQIAAMVQIQHLAGMRPGEVCAMTRAQIDRDAMPGVWIYRPVEHKNAHRGQALCKMLGPKAQTILAPWMLAAGEDSWPIFKPSRRNPKRCYSVEAYGRAINRACAAAQVKRFTAYQLRYDAERRAEAEAGLAGAGAILGHRRLETTANYAERQNLQLAAEIARKIG